MEKVKHFRNDKFKERKKHLGRDAEAAFDQYCLINLIKSERFGFEKVAFEEPFWKLADKIRCMPDRITCKGNAFNLVEIKGMGEERNFKIKEDDIETLLWWDDLLPVAIAVFDAIDCVICNPVSIHIVKKWAAKAEQGRFWDNKKKYFAIKKDAMLGVRWFRIERGIDKV